jgi:hypothetical protein
VFISSHLSLPLPDPGGAGAQEGVDLLATAAVEELRRRQQERRPDSRSLLMDAELWVTAEEWLAFRDAVHEAGVRLHDSAQRPRTAGTQRVSVTAFLFEMTVEEDRP